MIHVALIAALSCSLLFAEPRESGASLPEAREKPRVIHTERFPTVSGEVNIENSFGTVEIEAWDEPDARLTIEKSTRREYTSGDLQRAMDELDAVRVFTQRPSDGGLRVATEMPDRSLFSRPLKGKTNIELRYKLMLPRLVAVRVKHDVGTVSVRGMAGPIHATARAGEVRVRLTDDAPVRVDAQSRVGEVDSSLDGRSNRKALVGERYVREEAAAAREIYLRVGVGAIAIDRELDGERFRIPVELID